MTTRRLMDWDPASGVAVYWEEDGEGNMGQRTFQDVSGILDMNAEARNHCNPSNGAGDIRMVARIPLIVRQIWRNELGVDCDNPDHQEAVNKLLNDGDWAKLRTDGSRL